MKLIYLLFLPLFSFAIEHKIFAGIANETYQERGRCTALVAIDTPVTALCQTYLKHTTALLKLEDTLTQRTTPMLLRQYRNDLLNEHKNVRVLSTKIDKFLNKAIESQDMKTLSYLLESAYFATSMKTKKRISKLPHQERLSKRARHILYKYLHTTYTVKKALKEEQASLQPQKEAVCEPLQIRQTYVKPHLGTVNGTVVGVIDEGYVIQQGKQFLLLKHTHLQEELGIGELMHFVGHTNGEMQTYHYEESDRFMLSQEVTRKLLHVQYVCLIDKSCYYK
jgi:hypothetical protein